MKHLVLLSILALMVTGCDRNQTQTYRVPKEKSHSPVAEAVVEHTHEAPKSNLGFTAQLPDGWTEKPGSGMRMVSYSIEDTSIDFYLISLGMGDLTSNVNRWRKQIGLPETTKEEIEKAAESFSVDGIPVQYAELFNEEGGNGIIAAILEKSGSMFWYFTAKGSVDELKKHKDDIRAFVESVRMAP